MNLRTRVKCWRSRHAEGGRNDGRRCVHIPFPFSLLSNRVYLVFTAQSHQNNPFSRPDVVLSCFLVYLLIWWRYFAKAASFQSKIIWEWEARLNGEKCEEEEAASYLHFSTHATTDCDIIPHTFNNETCQITSPLAYLCDFFICELR